MMSPPVLIQEEHKSLNITDFSYIGGLSCFVFLLQYYHH